MSHLSFQTMFPHNVYSFNVIHIMHRNYLPIIITILTIAAAAAKAVG